MKDVNKIILIGRLGNDPVQRETKNGLAVVHFPLATSRRLADADPKDGDQPKEETQWHRVVVWGKQAEACKQYLDKGQAVFVEGSVRSRQYTNKDGTSRVAFEVHAENVSFLGRKKRLGEAAGEVIQAAESAMEVTA